MGENCEIGIPKKIPKVYRCVSISPISPLQSTERPCDHVPNRVKF